LRERARELNASVTTRLIVRQAPDPGNEVCRAAKEEEADLIVIATHARHHVAHLLIGSTTLAVLKDPPAPVLAIRYGTRRRRRMKRLLVPIHLKQTSTAALDLASAIAAREGGELQLVIVCDRADRGAAQAHAEQVAAVAANGAFRVERVVIEGTDVERELVRYADRSDVDAIVVHSSAGNGAGDNSMGDVKQAIIRSAETPVLIVPAP
jgi:nucleotide-binding universal stress UspA family protein